MSTNLQHAHRPPTAIATPTPFQSFSKSFLSFSKALVLFFVLTHLYMIVFLVIPNQFYGSTSNSKIGQHVDKPLKPMTIAKEEGEKKETETMKTTPKKQRIVTVKKVRDELTQEQLRRIHQEFNQMTSSSSDNNDGSTTIANNNKKLSRTATLKNLLRQVKKVRAYNQKLHTTANYILEKSNPTKLFDPKVKSVHKTGLASRRVADSALSGSGYNAEKNRIEKEEEERMMKKININSTLAFLKREHNYRDVDVHVLKHELLQQMKDEFEHLLELYSNGEIGIIHIEKVLEANGIQLKGRYNHNNDGMCDRNYLKIDPELYAPNDDISYIEEEEEKKDEEQEEEEDPDDGIYATKNYLTNKIQSLQQDIKNYYSQFSDDSDIDDATGIDDSHNLHLVQLPIRHEKESNLKETAMNIAAQHFSMTLQTAHRQYQTILRDFTNLQESIDIMKRDGLPSDEVVSSSNDKDNEECTLLEDAEDIAFFAMKYVTRLGMKVEDGMKKVVEGFNSMFDEEFHISMDELEKLPDSPRSSIANSFDREEKEESFQNLITLPIFMNLIKAFDEGVDFIAGYSDTLDRLIDFIAGFSKSEDGDKVDEGSVGQSLETVLLHLSKKIKMPKFISDKHGKAGILKEAFS